MQNFELESLPMGVDHSQMVKAAHVGSDSSSKGCVNLTSSTAVSRIISNLGIPSFKTAKREYMFGLFICLFVALLFILFDRRREAIFFTSAGIILGLLMFWHHATDILKINW